MVQLRPSVAHAIDAARRRLADAEVTDVAGEPGAEAGTSTEVTELQRTVALAAAGDDTDAAVEAAELSDGEPVATTATVAPTALAGGAVAQPATDEGTSNTCGMCWDDMEPGSFSQIYGCECKEGLKPVFHTTCINKWFTKGKGSGSGCPQCRKGGPHPSARAQRRQQRAEQDLEGQHFALLQAELYAELQQRSIDDAAETRRLRRQMRLERMLFTDRLDC